MEKRQQDGFQVIARVSSELLRKSSQPACRFLRKFAKNLRSICECGPELVWPRPGRNPGLNGGGMVVGWYRNGLPIAWVLPKDCLNTLVPIRVYLEYIQRVSRECSEYIPTIPLQSDYNAVRKKVQSPKHPTHPQNPSSDILIPMQKSINQTFIPLIL